METQMSKRDCPFFYLGLPVTATKQEVVKAYRELSMKHHPDRGGSHDTFVELGRQYNLALKQVKSETYIHDGETAWEFMNRILCTVCNGKGYVDITRGVLSAKILCPACHGIKK
jgi:DnaJ-class molecular chaperone